MRLTFGKDFDLQGNLRILQLCSRFKTVKLFNSIRKLEDKQEQLLMDPKYSSLRNFLEYVSRQEDMANNRNPKDMYTTEYLSSVVVTDDYDIPNDLGTEFEKHQKQAKVLSNKMQTANEHGELLDVLSGHTKSDSVIPRRVNLKELIRFLNDKNHSNEFRTFAETMQKRKPINYLL